MSHRSLHPHLGRWLAGWWPRLLAVALMLAIGAQLGAATASIASVAIVAPRSDYVPSQSLLIDVTFSEPVQISGSPSFTLNTGGTASYLSGSATSVLTFVYVIGSTDHTNSTGIGVTNGSKISTGLVTTVNPGDTPGNWAWPGSLTPVALIAPMMSAASFGATFTDSTTLTCTFTCTEPLTTFTSGDLLLGGTAAASIGTITATSTGFTVAVTVSASGTVTLGVRPSSSAADADGNVIDATTSATAAITVGPVPQIAAIQAITASPTAATSVSWLVTFTTPVQNVSGTNFTATGTGLSGITASAGSSPSATWTVTANGVSGSGVLTLALASLAGITDGGGDPLVAGTASPDQTITIDQTAPTVTAITMVGGVATSDAATLTYQVTFSTTVIGVAGNNVSVTPTGGAVCTVGAIHQVSGSVYQVQLTGVSIASGSGTVPLTISPAGITDAVGNALSAAMPAETPFTVVPVPVLSSIATVTASPSDATSVSYTVTFNVPVSGVVAAKFAAQTTGSVTAPVSACTPAGPSASYTVTLSPVAGDGTLALANLNTTGVTDSVGEAIAVSGLTSAAITVDHTAPTIQSITVLGANPTNAASPSFLVLFSEPVTGLSTASFTPDGIGGAVTAVTPSGSSGAVVTVAAAGNGALGIVVNAGLADPSGNALNLAPPANDQQVLVERGAPLIQAITLLDTNPISEPGPVRYAVTFSVPVGDVTAANFAVPTASLQSAPTIGAPSAVGGGAFASTWVVQISGIALATSVTNVQLPLQFNASGSPSIQDALGNVASSALPGSNVSTYTITVQQPGLTLGAPQNFTERGPAVLPFVGTLLQDPGTTQFNVSGQHASIDVALSISSPVAVAPLTVADDPSDMLWLNAPAGFTLGATAVTTGTNVAIAPLLLGATQVGTVTFTPSLTADQSFLHIDLSGNFLVSDAQNLIDGITFDNTHRNPSASGRQLFLSVIDGTGRASTPAAQHLSMVLINDSVALVAGQPEITTAPAARIVVPGQTLTGHIPTNDVDSFFTCALVDGTGGLHAATASIPATLATAQGTITVSLYGDWTYVAGGSASGADSFKIQVTDIGPNQGVFGGPGDALLAPAIIVQPVFVVAISSGPQAPLITSNPPVEAEVGGTFDYHPAANLTLPAAQIGTASYDIIDLDSQGFAANRTFVINAATGELTCADVPAGSGYIHLAILLQVTDLGGITRGTYQPILVRTVSTNGSGG